MTRIVHLSTTPPAGDARVLHKQCRTLARAGYEVVLLAPEGPGPILRDPEVRIRPLPGLAARKICRAAMAEDAALYHVHGLGLLGIARRLHRAGRRVVLDVVGRRPADTPGCPWIPRVLRRAVALGRHNLTQRWLADVPIVWAEEPCAEGLPWVRRSVVVHNYPIVDEMPPAAGPVDPPTVGYAGVVDPAHGSVAILEAMAILRRFDHAPRLECAGPVSPRHRLELLARAKRLGLGQVRLGSSPTPQETWGRIAGARIGLAVPPPGTDPADCDLAGLLDYMALAIPVVASDIPRYRELLERTGCGVCVDPTRPEEIAGAMAWLLDNPELAWTMGRAGRRAVLEHYDWNREATRLLAFYERLLREAGLPAPWTSAVHPQLVPFGPTFRADC